MTEQETIKAIEHCMIHHCSGCPSGFGAGCITRLWDSVLDLINAKNAKLKAKDAEVESLKQKSTKRSVEIILLSGEIVDYKRSFNELLEKYKAIKSERDEALAEVELTKKRLRHLLESDYIRRFDEVDPRTKEYLLDIQTATGFPLRIGTTIVDKDKHGEYYMIQCATEQAAQRRIERGD